MKLELEIKQEVDSYDDTITYQELTDEKNDIHFSVANLDWQPEDAIIGRELFSAGSYIKALNKGIELANKGYTEVVGKVK